jgi:hypothetical protein
MRRLKIGEPLHTGGTGFEEGVHYNYTPGGHTLTLSTMNPGPSEIYDVRKGQSVFALGVAEEALFLFAKFGDGSWQVANYNWWINPPVMRPDPTDDLQRLRDGLSLNVCLVSASNGLVEALRSVRLSLEFGSFLLGSIEQQARRPFDPWHYLDVVEKATARYRDESSIMREVTCLCIADVSFADSMSGGIARA